MKYIITESQYAKLMEQEEKQKVLHIPDFKLFSNDWDVLQRFLESKGNPPYSLGGNLSLVGLEVESLGNLVSVEGDIYAYNTPLKSLGSLTSVGGMLYLSHTDIKSLGNLKYVGGDLNLRKTKVKNLGNLKSVGGSLLLGNATKVPKEYWKEELNQTVEVGGDIYL